jgi:thiol:disulfide interchange protein
MAVTIERIRHWRAHDTFFRALNPGPWIFIAALALLTLAATARAAGLPDQFDPARDAAADVAQAVATASAEGKRVIVDVGGEWCSWCHILDRLIAGNADVNALVARNYVWVKVNFSKENRNEALLSRWPKIKGYPHLFVLDGNGELLHSQDTSVLEAGRGYDRARVVDFLNRWAPRRTASRV